MSGAAFARTREIRGSHLLEIFDELLPRDGIRFVVSRLENFEGISSFRENLKVEF